MRDSFNILLVGQHESYPIHHPEQMRSIYKQLKIGEGINIFTSGVHSDDLRRIIDQHRYFMFHLVIFVARGDEGTRMESIQKIHERNGEFCPILGTDFIKDLKQTGQDRQNVPPMVYSPFSEPKYYSTWPVFPLPAFPDLSNLDVRNDWKTRTVLEGRVFASNRAPLHRVVADFISEYIMVRDSRSSWTKNLHGQLIGRDKLESLVRIFEAKLAHAISGNSSPERDDDGQIRWHEPESSRINRAQYLMDRKRHHSDWTDYQRQVLNDMYMNDFKFAIDDPKRCDVPKKSVDAAGAVSDGILAGLSTWDKITKASIERGEKIHENIGKQIILGASGTPRRSSTSDNFLVMRRRSRR